MNSLDPRVTRLPDTGVPGKILAKAPYDQFGTFEVFVQSRAGKPFQHEGAVHAPNLEMAYVLAKETFTRRFACVSLFVVDTRNVYVSPTTENDQSAYETIPDIAPQTNDKSAYEIFHLLKRGKQHIHVTTVTADTPQAAMAVAKKEHNATKIVYNIWAIRKDSIRFTKPEDHELWLTLPEKKFRDASDYKGGDKLKSFLEKSQA